MRALALLVPLTLGLLVADRPARADEAADTAEAKQRFQRGMAHFRLDEYEDAATEFLAGYRLKPDPVFLYNVGQAYRLSHHPAQALDYYEKYLRYAERAPNRAEVETRIRELRRLLREAGEVERRQPAGPMAPSGVDEPPTEAPPGSVTPPPPAAPATAPARPGLDLEVRQAPPHPTPIYRRWWLWTAAAAVVAIAGLSIGLTLGLSSPAERSLPDLVAR